MAETVWVMGANWREASAYGKEHDVETSFVTTPAQIRWASKIVVLPSFKRRRDGAVLAAALRSASRYARHGLVVTESDWEWDEPKPPAPEVAPEVPVTEAAKAALQHLADQRGVSLEEVVESLAPKQDAPKKRVAKKVPAKVEES